MKAIKMTNLLTVFERANGKDRLNNKLRQSGIDFEWLDDDHIRVLTQESGYEIFLYSGDRGE